MLVNADKYADEGPADFPTFRDFNHQVPAKTKYGQESSLTKID